ncbi:MAG: hypothetical protein MZV65_39720 [Chromatiales bacterium]|nr:hypothetical protein [Chromatiales bacterium]MCK7581165.1 hypothetical protein [Chromatiales bacterium]
MSEKITWFRLYAEAVDDEKLRLLAFEDRWHYIAILCCKGQGILDENNDSLLWRKVAVKLGVQVRELEEIARRLAEVGLIDQGTLQPCGWDKRQFISDRDPTAAERQRRKRERDREHQATETVTDESPVTVTESHADRHGPVTLPETETETETYTPLTPRRGDASAPQDDTPSSRKRETFTKPTVGEVAAYIREKGYAFDAEVFVEYYNSNGWRVGGRAAMRDWKAACVTWQKRRDEEAKAKSGFPPAASHNPSLARKTNLQELLS